MTAIRFVSRGSDKGFTIRRRSTLPERFSARGYSMAAKAASMSACRQEFMHYLHMKSLCRERYWSISLAAHALQFAIRRGDLL
jgi:hypothetical protein